MYVSLSEIQIKEEEEAMNRPFTKVGDHFTCVASDGFPRPVPVACFPAPFTCVWFLALSGRLALACFPALSSCYMFPALKKRKNFHPRFLPFTSFQEHNVSLFSLSYLFPAPREVRISSCSLFLILNTLLYAQVSATNTFIGRLC